MAVCVCVHDDVDDAGTVQRDDNFGHENICIGSHPTSAIVSREAPSVHSAMFATVCAGTGPTGRIFSLLKAFGDFLL